MRKSEVSQFIMAALFISGESLPIDLFGKIARMDNDEINSIVDELMCEQKNKNAGIFLIRIENNLQLCTNPNFSEQLKLLFAPPIKEELSKSVMETLSIIAYKQPITRAEIDNIRGVNSNYTVSILKQKGLIIEQGKKDIIGRPALLCTTEEFLRHFGITSLHDLPNIEHLDSIHNKECK